MIGAKDDGGVYRTISNIAHWHPRPSEGDIRQIDLAESDQPEADYVGTIRFAVGDRSLGQWIRDHANCGCAPEVSRAENVLCFECPNCDEAIRLHVDSFSGNESRLNGD